MDNQLFRHGQKKLETRGEQLVLELLAAHVDLLDKLLVQVEAVEFLVMEGVLSSVTKRVLLDIIAYL